MPETPDEILVGQAKTGDSAAREELFRRHFGVAHRVAHRLLGHEHDAEEAVQDGFLKAVLHLREFDGRSHFRTWLLRIVTNAALDIGRKRKRRPILQLETERLNGTEAIMLDDPAAGLYRQDLREALDSALERLTETTRTTFVLFAEAGLSYQEIADLQGVPLGTVMSRLYYARQKLQANLGGIEAAIGSDRGK